MPFLQLFGSVALVGDDGPLSGPAAQRRRLALLAVLATSPSGAVSRDKLTAYFWPEEDRERSRHFLADSLFTLRRGLGKDAVLAVGDNLLLNAEVVDCDVRRFHEALAAGDRERAVALYTGPFLDGFFISDAPEFERWAETERDRLARLHAEALQGLAEAREAEADPAAAVIYWRRLAAHDPLSSRVALRLMQALAASGERAAALQHARVHAALLREEIGSGPDAQVEELAARLALPPEPPAPLPAPVPQPRPALPFADGGAAPGGEPAAPPPGEKRAAPPRFPGARPARVLALLLALLAASAAGWLRASRVAGPQPAAGPPSATSIAVLPFSIRGDPELAYLGEGLVTLLSSSLDGAGEFRPVDPYRLLGHTARLSASGPLSPERAAELTRALGAQQFLLGSVVESGGRLRITASLYRPGNPPAEEVRAAAEGEDVFVLVDELSRQLLAGRLGTPADRLSRVALSATRSLPALKAYLQGEQEFRAARYPQAAAAFRRAVRGDPSFALAYYRLSCSAEWSFRFTEARHAAARALRLSERLSPRDQRLIAAWHAFVTGDAAEAERIYDALLTDDPLDVEAWSGLGEVRLHYNPVLGRPVAEAAPAFERVLQLAPRFGEARFHMLELAASGGRAAAFDSLLAGVDPQSQQALAWQAARAFAWGTPAEIEAVERRLRDAEDVVVGIAAVRTAAHFRDLRAAEALARLLTRPARPESWRAAGHVMIAQGLLARAEWDAALARLDSAAVLEPDWAMELRGLSALLPFSTPDAAQTRRIRSELEAWDPGRTTPETAFFFATHADVHVLLRSYLLAMLSVRLGEDDAAEHHLQALARAGSTREGRELATALARSVEAHRAWRHGDAERALRILENTRLRVPLERIALSPFFARSLDRYLRAEALRALGRPEEALRWYDSLSEGPDLLFWAAARQRRSALPARAAPAPTDSATAGGAGR